MSHFSRGRRGPDFEYRAAMVRIAALLSLLWVVACDSGPAPPGADGGVDLSIFPIAPGMKWTYRVTSGSGEVAEKVQTVTGTIAYEGKAAFRFETQRVGLKEAVSIQAVEGDRVVGSIGRAQSFNVERCPPSSRRTEESLCRRALHDPYGLQAFPEYLRGGRVIVPFW